MQAWAKPQPCTRSDVLGPDQQKPDGNAANQQNADRLNWPLVHAVQRFRKLYAQNFLSTDDRRLFLKSHRAAFATRQPRQPRRALSQHRAAGGARARTRDKRPKKWPLNCVFKSVHQDSGHRACA